MSIVCRCPHCAQLYRLKDRHAGRQALCRQCRKIFTVPFPPAAAARADGGSTAAQLESPGGWGTDLCAAPDATPCLAQIEQHVEKTIGPIGQVFHELSSGQAAMALLVVPPTRKPPGDQHPLGTDHFTIVTAGLSAREMNVPADESPDVPRLAELMIALPGDWPGIRPDGSFDRDLMDDPRFWWPIRCLMTIAHLPHDQGTYLAMGHTIPNGQPAEPYASDTKLSCMLLMPPILSPGAMELPVGDDARGDPRIHFYALCPIHPQEMNYKLKRGTEKLFELFQRAEMTELIRPQRQNLCTRRLGLV
ncbi:suppressor of fused domain protein [Fontivita pretiosa]|uniref:suppressor of fused domain protein n=1 Tax=Fontivita pretiosa TaxID=2989684 RepID=UPI003D177735